MSFSPNVPELDIALSQQIVVRFWFCKKLLQWYAMVCQRLVMGART